MDSAYLDRSRLTQTIWSGAASPGYRGPFLFHPPVPPRRGHGAVQLLQGELPHGVAWPSRGVRGVVGARGDGARVVDGTEWTRRFRYPGAANMGYHSSSLSSSIATSESLSSSAAACSSSSLGRFTPRLSGVPASAMRWSAPGGFAGRPGRLRPAGGAPGTGALKMLC